MDNEVIPELIASQEWLEPFADLLQKLVHTAAEESGALKDFLHGVWLGHPLHPVLTDIPVGAWTAAAVLDAVEALSGREQTGSDVAIAVGLAGALGSAVTGLTDWSETDGPAKRVGVVHGVLNIAAATLYAASLASRIAKRRRAGIALSTAGYAIAFASAYLGGHLVFGEQIGVDHTSTADTGKPEHFVRVCGSDELRENTPMRVEADGIAILLVKRSGRIHAISETCPHLGGPLSEGKLVGDVIQCPWHGSRLSIEDGHVVGGPTTFPARCYDVRERSGGVEVRARK